MYRLDIINELNNYFIDEDDNSKKKIVELMNSMIQSNSHKENLDLFFIAISITELYGFLSYLTEEDRNYFFMNDYFKPSSYSSKSIPFLNSGQLSLLNELEMNKKVFVSAPTSFGKTSIVNEYVLTHLEQLKFVIYIVPTNSLLEELFIKFTGYLKGKREINISTQPVKSNKEKSVMFLTPERFLVFFEEYGLNDVGLLVMDESYKIMEFNNLRVSDFINSRSMKFRKVADIVASALCQSIFLSPFTYTLTASMERFLEKYSIKKIDRKLEYVSRKIECIDLTDQFKKVFPQAEQRYRTSDNMWTKTSVLIQNLVEEKNIVYVSGYSDAYKIAEEFQVKIQLKKVNERFKKFLEHLNSNYSIDDKTKWKVVSSLEKGIGIYIAPVPRYIKKEIIRLFEENQLHTLIVTTSFTEGVNTDAKNLIFTTLQTGGGRLAAIDTLNVAGRAGRFGKNSIGKIYCIKRQIFNEVNRIHEEDVVRLENYNYYLENEKPKSEHMDFEIDMMDDEFLNEEDVAKKKEFESRLENYNLTLRDLNISLNVSNNWKLNLYSWFSKNIEKHQIYYDSIIELQNATEKVKAITVIFDAMRSCFSHTGDQSVNVFPTEIYDIRAYDRSGNFTWGRLYKIFSSGTTIEVLRRNQAYIRGRYKAIMQNNPTKDRNQISEIFKRENALWILNKYYQTDCIKEDDDAFYTEAFKFVSSVIQYKIPYYIGFFVSIFKLFLQKNDIGFDPQVIDVKKIVLSFEESDYQDENTRLFIDYGLSNDLITKIKDNNITVQKIIVGEYDQALFDEFENLLIEDFADIMR